MWLPKWLPWKLVLQRAAKAHGFLDPVTLLARLRRFGHPSEVHEPIELIRAGVVFHARGLINTRAIQYNLDWIWPFWIEKQFRPKDVSFIPRGFAFSHVNLTHRNWTAVGHPDLPHYPIVDPRGLVTPYLDGWSIDFWILSKDGRMLVPARTDDVQQRLRLDKAVPTVSTCVKAPGFRLDTAVWVEQEADGARTHIQVKGRSVNGGQLVMALRPYNPEGIHLIDRVAIIGHRRHFQVNTNDSLRLDRTPRKVLFSTYDNGDVAHALDDPERAVSVSCDIGMATAAALFPMEDDNRAELAVSLALAGGSVDGKTGCATTRRSAAQAWREQLAETARLQIPDGRITFLYEAAVRTLVLLTAGDAYPGPYTYKRFWFRDACLMIHALLGIGLVERARRMVLDFPRRQTLTGYFRSQEGEWDSNGQVLWIAGRLHELGQATYDRSFLTALYRGADWIAGKRLPNDEGKPHQGMLPAGFSAEHLGPNDYYYWDNFWAVAGLAATARLAGEVGDVRRQKALQCQADRYRQALLHSIGAIPAKRRKGAIPASPYRRMDAGAVGSLVADYPLQLLAPNDPMTVNTVAYLMENCFHSGAFFQDMIHAGINIYLTLAIAQSLLRAGDFRYRRLIVTVADLATPTGQWPEAIHPFTKGGCMGDGQHGWAAAEWLMMIRNLFVREEEQAIFIGSGLFPEWIDSEEPVSFGPTPIPGGRLTVRLQQFGEKLSVDVVREGKGIADVGRNGKPLIAAVPGYAPKPLKKERTFLEPSRPL